MRGRALLVGWLAVSSAAAHVGDDERVEMLSGWASLRPSDAWLLRERASLHVRGGRTAEALSDLRRAAELGPEPRGHLVIRALALRVDAPADAVADLDLFLDSGEPTKLALVTRAELRSSRGSAALALDDYEAALTLAPDPDVAVAAVRLAVAACDLDRAVGLHERSMLLLGAAPLVTTLVAEGLVAAGDTARALDVTTRALGSSDDASLRLLYASLLASSGKRREATAERRAVLASIDQTLARRDTALGRLLRARALLALDRRAEARRELSRVTKAQPDLLEARTLLADVQEPRP